MLPNLNASGGDTCSWSPTTGVVNPNSCNTTAIPTKTTTYTVTVTDNNGCTDTASVTVTVDSANVIPYAIINLQFAVSISPNPFSTYAVLRITSLDELRMKDLKLMIYDLLGQEITLSIICNSDSFVISRGNLPEGIYFYKVKKDKKIISTGKLVIQ